MRELEEWYSHTEKHLRGQGLHSQLGKERFSNSDKLDAKLVPVQLTVLLQPKFFTSLGQKDLRLSHMQVNI